MRLKQVFLRGEDIGEESSNRMGGLAQKREESKIAGDPLAYSNSRPFMRWKLVRGWSSPAHLKSGCRDNSNQK